MTRITRLFTIALALLALGSSVDAKTRLRTLLGDDGGGETDESGRDPDSVRLDLADKGWEITGDGARVEEHLGESALRLLSGKATWRDIQFEDGTIEFDLAVTSMRAFAYLYFRMVDDDEHEEIYLRTHKSLLPDAIQYTPVYKGASQWQLYHDERSTAAAHLPPGEWIHVRLVVAGRRAALFVGDAAEPQLVMQLARDPQPGFLALRAFKAFREPADTVVANFANLVVRPGLVDYAFPAVEVVAPPPGRVDEWRISPAFAPADGPVLSLPEDLGEWQTVAANGDGFVEIERHVTRSEAQPRSTVLARLEITAAEASTRRLDLGFSDEISVFFNGALLLTDDESYSFNTPRRQGLLGTDQLSIHLPLKEGENELVLAVTDRFGGWALAATFDDPRGLTIDAE